MNSTIKTTVLFSAMSLLTLSIASAQGFTPITRQLNPGNRGVDVTNLQTFFAANPSVYPEGRVTGYFGGLTKSAVMNYQGQNGLDQVGRVGPATLMSINNRINSGGWVLSDINAPLFYNIGRNMTGNQSNFTFNTNENTTAYVAYSTSPIRIDEGNMDSSGFAIINGIIVNSASSLNTTHNVTISGLSANTMYYYVVVAKDSAGNVSVWGVNNTFTTTQ